MGLPGTSRRRVGFGAVAALLMVLLPLQVLALARNRTPTLTDRYRTAVAVALSGVATGDFNGDGLVDVVGTITTGMGVFLAPAFAAPAHTIADVDDPAVADVDGDGDLDIVALDHSKDGSSATAPIRSGRGVVTLLNDGRAGFAPVPFHFEGWSVSTIAGLADLTGDGHADLVFIGARLSKLDSNVVALAPGQGGGRFAAPEQVPGLGGAGQVVGVPTLADLDGDGRLDLLASTGSQLLVVRSLGGGRFVPPQVVPGPRGLGAFAVADLNGDGAPDVVASVSGGAELAVLWNRNGTLVGGPVVKTHLHSSQSFPDFVASGDFDGDGHPDLLLRTANVLEVHRQPPGYGVLRVYLNDGKGGFSGPHALAGRTARSRPLLLADLDGDAITDIVGQRQILVSRASG